MNIDERIVALTHALELQGSHIAMLLEDSKTRTSDIEQLIEQARVIQQIAKAHSEDLRKDGENIRALANIAAAHERRLSDLEGGDTA